MQNCPDIERSPHLEIASSYRVNESVLYLQYFKCTENKCQYEGRKTEHIENHITLKHNMAMNDNNYNVIKCRKIKIIYECRKSSYITHGRYKNSLERHVLTAYRKVEKNAAHCETPSDIECSPPFDTSSSYEVSQTAVYIPYFKCPEKSCRYKKRKMEHIANHVRLKHNMAMTDNHYTVIKCRKIKRIDKCRQCNNVKPNRDQNRLELHILTAHTEAEFSPLH